MEKRNFLLLLLAIDFILMLFHIFHNYSPFLNSEMFSIAKDQGIAEIFGYLKWILIVVGLIIIRKQENERRYLSWALLFIYLLTDDAFSLHERVGYHIEKLISLTFFGLNGQNVGELLYFTCVGIPIIGWLIFNYWKGGALYKQFSRNLIALFCLLVFFGVFIDLGRTIFPKNHFYALIDLLEDGGELIVASFILSFINSKIDWSKSYG